MPQRNNPIQPMQDRQAESRAKKGVLGGLGALGAAVALILTATLDNEGGYVNHPSDPGGATNHGVTERVARAAGYRGHMRDFPKHCDGPVTVCADSIYFDQYIRKPGYLPVIEADPAVGGELVDSAVNFGPPRPSRWFQQAMNELGGARLAVDGKIGPASVGAYRSLQVRLGKVRACVATLDRLDAKQRAEYDRLVRVNPKLRAFHKGWVAHRIGNIDRKTCGRGI
jgi:lysozyme family protein